MQPIKIIPLHAARTGSWSNGTEQGAVWLSADLSLFASVWPQGQPAVSFERADGQKYAHACRMEDNLLYIPLDYADTEVPGLCKCAVSWLDGEREVRTTVYYGHVQQTITTLGVAPTEPEKGIIEQVNAAAVRAEKAADRAEAAGGGGGGSGGAVDEETVKQIVDEYLAENPPAPGADGYTPVKGVDYFTPDEIQDVAEQAAQMVEITQVLPENVVFPDGASTTYPIGKVELVNGMGELVPKGGTLKDFFNQFIDEKPPETTDPAVSLTFSQAKAYEVGTKVTPTYSASLSAGSYTYGPATGVYATAWSVTDTAGNTARTTASGSFPQLTVSDGMSYKITAKATHNAGATPVTNTGNAYAAGKIAAGTKSATSGAVTGYRNTFYGTLEAKTAPSVSVIRGLSGKSGKSLANGSSFTVTVPVGALRVIIAYPATLRDVSSIKDVNGLNAEISSGFSKQTVSVTGANSYSAINYKVYIMDFAEANDKANKYTVTI